MMYIYIHNERPQFGRVLRNAMVRAVDAVSGLSEERRGGYVLQEM